MESDFLLYACALNRIFAYNGVLARHLAESFDNLSDIFSLTYRQLREVIPLHEHYINEILDHENLEWAQRELQWADKYGVRLLYLTDQEYPYRLRECPDAPLLLYYLGNAALNPRKVLSIVGTRKASVYGKECCNNIISQIGKNSEKTLIVSGLAYGIDANAHRCALENQLPTIAVLPTGLDTIYPQLHRDLSKQIIQNGALISDFPTGTTPFAHNFIRRNRIIAGMADAVLLGESFAKGGGLITTKIANSYSREVFAIPGRMTDASFVGCNHIISSNIANIITSPKTIEQYMGWDNQKPNKKELTLFDDNLNETKKAILIVLKDTSPLNSEEILQRTGLPIADVSMNLIELEMDGIITISNGNNYTYLDFD